MIKPAGQSVLDLNTDDRLKCNKLIYLRAAQTVSSSLSYNVFTRIRRVRPLCDASLYRHPTGAPEVSYMITESVLARRIQPNLSLFDDHVKYTTGLARLMRDDYAY